MIKSKFVCLALASVLTLAGAVSAQTEEALGAGASAIEAAKTDNSNWRSVDPERLIIFETTKGRILIETFPEIAPRHVAQFTAIVRSGDYDGTSFHRVIDGFMAQGGDLEAFHGRTSGLPNIEAEFFFRRVPAELPFDMIGDPNSSLDGYFMGLPVRSQSKFLAELSSDGRVESYV
ncbi:MAG: peptidylprolyl isomerase, partial [Pseudomonadota bacterium]